MFKNRKKEQILKKLENCYLFGVDCSNDYLELITYDLNTKKVESNFYDIKDEEFIAELHKRRREDSIKSFNKLYNDVSINEVEGNMAVMSFIQDNNKFKVNYSVSRNLIRKKEEMEFITSYVDLYSMDRKLFGIDNKIIDINQYKKGSDTPKGCNILLLDEQNYGKELHLFGELICKEIIPRLKEEKEIANIERRI